MVSHTVRLDGRKGRELKLKPDEAQAMMEKGFRFGEFNPEAGSFRISRPYETIVIVGSGELTFRQS